ncbi:MAG: hypothetical protein U0821_07295 [Chloroflexota bacterium]
MGWQIFGHDRQVAVLDRAVRTGSTAHAYLITGPASVGKSLLGRELARALNCERGTNCGTCRRCRLILAERHPEVQSVGVKPPHRLIRVDDVESIQADAALRPTDASKKVFIIEQAELLQPDAATRLLKTMEEPPPHVCLVLTCSDAAATLATVVSRCQQLRLRPVAKAALERWIAERSALDAAQASLIATLAQGRPGAAARMADDPSLLDQRAAALSQLRELLAADRFRRLGAARELADQWSAKPGLVRATLGHWTAWLRDAALVQRGRGGLIRNPDCLDDLLRAAGAISRPASAAARLRDVVTALDQNANPRLALDVAVLELPHSG